MKYLTTVHNKKLSAVVYVDKKKEMLTFLAELNGGKIPSFKEISQLLKGKV